MSQSIKNVVLVGASGNVGAPILRALLDCSKFNLTVLSRDDSEAKFPPDVKVIKTDYSEPDLVRALQGQDAIVSTVGATGFSAQKTIIDAAVKAGVKRFLPSELSSNTTSDKVRELVPVFEAKKEILDYLKTKELEGLTWTGISTGPWLDMVLENGFLGYDLTKQTAEIWDDGSKAFTITTTALACQSVISILLHPDETANQYLFIRSVTTTQKEILKSLEAATKTNWQVNNVTTVDQITRGKEMVSEGDFTGMFMLVKASMMGAVGGIRSDYEHEEKLANSLLGLPEENLDDIILSVVGKN